MKIVSATPYSITVEDEGLKILIAGESFIRGYGSPDFMIDANSIQYWERGGSKEIIKVNDNDRARIIDFVLNELRGRGWLIESE